MKCSTGEVETTLPSQPAKTWPGPGMALRVYECPTWSVSPSKLPVKVPSPMAFTVKVL